MTSLEHNYIENWFYKFFPNEKSNNRYEVFYSYVDMTVCILNEIDKKNEYKRTNRTTIQSNTDTYSIADKYGYINYEKLMTLVEKVILLKKLEILESE